LLEHLAAVTAHRFGLSPFIGTLEAMQRDPCRTPTTLPTLSIPAAEMSLGLTRISGAPPAMNFGRTSRPIGVLMVSTW
jgi:hypothetical protein